MLGMTEITRTFPSAHLPSLGDGLPVDVVLVAQLGHGAGDQLFEQVAARQRGHAQFIDALEEPSARLADTDLPNGDATALYSFVVGPNGHPFHRHAGHRMFTAVSGSGGAQLRFSSATAAQMAEDPQSFVHALRYVDVPPDCLFTVRFGGETWHQFAPLRAGARHPAFFALSCHTNELGGALSADALAQVMNNTASIPALTEVLPPAIMQLLSAPGFEPAKVPTIALSLDAMPGSMHSAMCASVRGRAGVMRGLIGRLRKASGFLADNGGGRAVVELHEPHVDSLLTVQFSDGGCHHEDTFALTLAPRDMPPLPAGELLAHVLDGFLHNSPQGVSRMMSFRNVLVRPLGLRTSPLGCPVSSLLSPQRDRLFAGRHPVLDQSSDVAGRHVQVLLGADDKHLSFRSCVGVELLDDGRARITLGTKVRCRNLFGRFYMAMIQRVHRGYITPSMLRAAVEHALGDVTRSTARSRQSVVQLAALQSVESLRMR